MAAIECELARIIISETTPSQRIVLREKNGSRQFPIVIGLVEALAIDREIKEEATPRPLTHDLLNNVIREMEGRVERIVVNDLRDGTFFARLKILRNGGTIDVDSRPSDAIALAVRCSARIFVEEKVLDAISRGVPEDLPGFLEAQEDLELPPAEDLGLPSGEDLELPPGEDPEPPD